MKIMPISFMGLNKINFTGVNKPQSNCPCGQDCDVDLSKLPNYKIPFKGGNIGWAWYNNHPVFKTDPEKDLITAKIMDDFLERYQVPKGETILDAGCGSGRDAKRFSELGYKVSAFDAAEEVVKHSSQETGLDIKTATFKNYESDELYGLIWARKSLLHVPKSEFRESVQNMVNHLKDGGLFYGTMKVGNGEAYDSSGRFFNYVSKDELKKVFSELSGVKIMELSEKEHDVSVNDEPIVEFVLKKRTINRSEELELC